MRRTVFLLAVCAAVRAFAGEFSVSTRVFADVSFRHNEDLATGALGSDSGGAFDLKRLYLTLDYRLNPLLFFRIRTDAKSNPSVPSRRFDIFIKNAFLEASFAPAFHLRIGVADTPWAPYVEQLYGLRYVENVLEDRLNYATTADWGLHALGELGTRVRYAVSVVNGRGFTDPTRSRAPTLELRVAVNPIDGVNLAIGGQVGKLGVNVSGTPTPNLARRVDLIAALERGRWRLGLQGFVGRNLSAEIVLGKAPENTALGGSAWGLVQVAPRTSLFARLDAVQPLRSTDPEVHELYLDAGVQLVPLRELTLALVYKRDAVRSGRAGEVLALQDGTVGSAEPHSLGVLNELGLFAQLEF